MSRLDVRRFEPGDEEQWNALVGRSRARHFLFHREYMSYHAERYEDFSLLIHAGGRLLAALPASREGDEAVSHGGLTFGGLIGDQSLTTRRTVEVLGAVLEFLREQGIRRFVYKPVPHIYHLVPGEEDLYALFVHGARLVRRDISSTLRPGRALARTKGRRSAVRQSRGAGLRVAESDRFAEFMVIEAEALQARHGVGPVHTPDELEILARRFPDNISLVAGLRGQEILAGVVVYETEVVAHAQYIGASSEGYALHALDLIIDHLVTERYRDKRFFDFGISTVEEGRVLNEGLIRNKESFGARATVYDAYDFAL
jgi:GNAT acetyltransferase-like protein